MKDKFIIFLILIALISGFFWTHKSLGQPIGTGGDEGWYDQAARGILEHKDFIYKGKPFNFEPLYPLFLAGIYSVFGYNWDAVRVFQIILFALTALIIYLLVKELFGKNAAILAGVFVALFGGLANLAGSLTREILFTFLLVLLVYTIYQSYLKNEKKWFALSGVILGLAVLTNVIVQYLFIFIILYFLLIYKREILRMGVLLRGFLFLLLFFITLSPWLLRNYLQFSALVVAPRGGLVLVYRAEMMEKAYKNAWGHLIGHTLGYYFAEKLYPEMDIQEFRQRPDSDKELKELEEQGYSAQEVDRILAKRGLSRILAAPHKYLFMGFLDSLAFNAPLIVQPPTLLTYNFLETFAEGRHPGLPGFLKIGILLTLRLLWLVFFFFIIYGLIKNWQNLALIFLIILYFNLIYSFLLVVIRYVMPIYPLYIILFAVGLFTFLKRHESFITNKFLI